MSYAVMLVSFVIASASHACAQRIWFSLTGVPEGEPIAGTPPEYISPTQGINPIVDPVAGMARLYVWGTLSPAGNYYHAASLDINIYPQAGDMALADSGFYNYYSPLYPPDRRWTAINQGIRTPLKLDDAWMSADMWFSWGWSLGAGIAGDLQYDPETWSMLLGFVDLQMSPDARGEIFLGVGDGGFATHPPWDYMHFGWDDEPVLAQLPYGQQSALPDATIVPEPAGLVLAILVGLGLRRRSRATPTSGALAVP